MLGHAPFLATFTLVAIRLSLSVTADADGFYLTPEFLDFVGSRSVLTLPERLHYEITFHEAKIVLILKRRHIRNNNLTIYYGHKKLSSTIQVYNYTDEDWCFYQDHQNMAALSLKIPADPRRTTHDMSGTFYYNGSMFYIEPIDRRRHVVHSSGARNSADATHHLRRIAASGGTVDHIRRNEKTDSFVSRTKGASSVEQTANDAPAFYRRLSRASEKPSYEVDLLYITDFSFFKRFETDMKVSRPSPTMEQITREIWFYLAHVENQVDLRYRGIDVPDWKMATKLVTIYIETSQSNSFWTETLAEPSSSSARPAVNASAALDKFTGWVRGSPPIFKSFPMFDHAVLFTWYDLYGSSDVSGERNYDTIGLAFSHEMCTSYSTSIVEFTGALTEGNTQAHELGHSLGANHDGVGNSCRESDQYIMAASSQGITGNSINTYQFSSCSVTSFREYVNTLNRNGNNCMLNTLPQYDTAAWQIDMGILPGTYYTIDDQCRQSFGPTYAAVAGVEYGPNVCAKLWCYNTASGDASGSKSLSSKAGAVDGTSCGNRKWCLRGACVYNPLAPANSDTCPHGDYMKDRKVFSNLPYTCSNLPSLYCYDAAAFNTCCKSCAEKYRLNSTDCQFGDRVENCMGNSLFSCRSDDYRRGCCQFCADNRLDIPNCDWGDYFSNCAPTMCGSQEGSCCQTCYKLTHPNWSPPTVKSQTTTTASGTKFVRATLPNLEKSQDFVVGEDSTQIVTTKNSASRHFALHRTVVSILLLCCWFSTLSSLSSVII